MANVGTSWEEDIQKELNDVGTLSELHHIEHHNWNKHSIYMVPAVIKDLNPKAYEPQIISFGPYHYDDEKLRPMEIHKRRALIHFLKRARKPLKDFMSALKEVVGVLTDFYQSLDERWTRGKEDFLRLMLLDGCFMLEVLRFRKVFRSSENDYDKNDPIFSRHGMLYIWQHIKMDMLRIENQLPLLVLKKLVAVDQDGRAPDDNEIYQLLLDFMGLRPVPSVGRPRLHPLDLFRKSCLRPPGDRTAPDSRQALLGTATQASGRPMEQKKEAGERPMEVKKMEQERPMEALEIVAERPMPVEALEIDEDHLQTNEEFNPHILQQHVRLHRPKNI